MLNSDIQDIVNNIDSIFCSNLQTIPLVRSIFSIGSMCSRSYEIKQNNDYDIRVYVSTMTADLQQAINEAAEACIETIHNHYDWLFVDYCDKIGPARACCPYGQKSLLIHCITLTKESFNSLPVMHRISYKRNYRLIWGEDVLALSEPLRLSLSGILKDVEGVEYCQSHLSSQTIEYLCWEKTPLGQYELISHKEPFSPNIAFEFYRYSISKCTKNLMDYFAQEMHPELAMKVDTIYHSSGLDIDFGQFCLNQNRAISKAILYLQELVTISKQWEVQNEAP